MLANISYCLLIFILLPFMQEHLLPGNIVVRSKSRGGKVNFLTFELQTP